MPIKPENAKRYPPDWQKIRQRILERASHRCEKCGLGNYWWGYRDTEGVFHLTGFNERKANYWPALSEIEQQPPADQKIFVIVLTIAHLDHIPENCDPENLRAWCQKCHLDYDKEHHQQTAYQTRREGKAVADLFGDAQ